MNKSALNAQLLGSQAAAVVTPKIATVVAVNGVMQRVRPILRQRLANNPDALSTVASSGTMSSSKYVQPGGPPAGRAPNFTLEGALRIAGGGTQGIYSAGRNSTNFTTNGGTSISGGPI